MALFVVRLRPNALYGQSNVVKTTGKQSSVVCLVTAGGMTISN